MTIFTVAQMRELPEGAAITNTMCELGNRSVTTVWVKLTGPATSTCGLWQRGDGVVYADQLLHVALHVRGGATEVSQ